MRRQASLIPPRRRFLLIALVLSVCAHLAAALLIITLPHMLTREAQPQEPSTVELLMVEQKGTHSAQPAPPKDTPAPKPPKVAVSPAVEEQKAQPVTPASKPAPTLPLPEGGEEPAAPPTPPVPPNAEARANQANAEPAVPRSQEAPVFDLEGTGSESNAMVLGGRVLPAMQDDRFRNQPPAYPAEAEVLGEHGAVVVLIHVSADGAAAGADILESSGHDILDQAAVAAVRKWHFHPAMEAGRAVPSTMPFRFIFEP